MMGSPGFDSCDESNAKSIFSANRKRSNEFDDEATFFGNKNERNESIESIKRLKIADQYNILQLPMPSAVPSTGGSSYPANSDSHQLLYMRSLLNRLHYERESRRRLRHLHLEMSSAASSLSSSQATYGGSLGSLKEESNNVKEDNSQSQQHRIQLVGTEDEEEEEDNPYNSMDCEL